MPGTAPHPVLVVSDALARSTRCAALIEAAPDLDPLPQPDLATAERKLAGDSSVRVVVLDVIDRTARQLAALAEVSRRHREVRFVVLVEELSEPVVLEAMASGARNCLPLDQLELQLLPALRRQLGLEPVEPVAPEPDTECPGSDVHGPDAHGPGAPGPITARVLTAIATSGGVGCTTLAVHLAEALGTAEELALLVDLDGYHGGVAAQLGLHPTGSVGDWLEALDPSGEFRGAGPEVERVSAQLAVLASPVSVDTARRGPLHVPDPGALLRAASRGHGTVVLDAPRLELDTTAALARHSTAALLVFELNVADVRTARSLAAALVERGVEPSRLIAVANRWRRHNPLVSLDDAREALGELALVTVANDFESCLRAQNFGQLLGQVAPKSPVLADIAELARGLSDRPGPERRG